MTGLSPGTTAGWLRIHLQVWNITGHVLRMWYIGGVYSIWHGQRNLNSPAPPHSKKARPDVIFQHVSGCLITLMFSTCKFLVFPRAGLYLAFFSDFQHVLGASFGKTSHIQFNHHHHHHHHHHHVLRSTQFQQCWSGHCTHHWKKDRIGNQLHDYLRKMWLRRVKAHGLYTPLNMLGLFQKLSSGGAHFFVLWVEGVLLTMCPRGGGWGGNLSWGSRCIWSIVGQVN